MADYEIHVEGEREVQLPALAVPVGSEIDIQIATARRYPRSLTLFKQRVVEIAGIDQEFADECTYQLPARQGSSKMISGPSVRFAEVLAHCYGNNRVAARIVDVDDRFATAQGAFFDLETNVATTFDVKVQVRDRDGNTYGDSLIATTCNAACSRALRSAVLKGIPKSIWEPLHRDVRRIAVQGPETLEAKRRRLFQFCDGWGITPEQVLRTLRVSTPEDIDAEKLDELRGYITAFKEGHATVDEIFGARPQREPANARRSPLNDILDGKRNGNGKPPTREVAPTPEWPEVGKPMPNELPF